METAFTALGIDKLSFAERILLVEEIWDSIVPEASQMPLPDSQRQDLERRIAEYDANPTGSSWDDVKESLFGQPLNRR